MENRISNIVWTVAEDYDFKVDLDLFSTNIKSPYKAALLGYFYQIYNMDLVADFLNRSARTKSNNKDLLFIAEITMENAVSNFLIENRPGVDDFKIKYEKDILHHYTIVVPKDIKEELEKSYYEYINNIPYKINHSLEKLLLDIIKFKSTKTSDLIIFLDKVYKKYFHVNTTLKEDEEVKKIIEKSKKEPTLSNKTIRTKNVENTSLENLEKFTIESAEFTSQDFSDSKIVIDDLSLNSGKNKNLYDTIRKHYGEETLNEKEVLKLENKVCTGIHEGIKLFFTKGEFKHKDSQYYKNRAEDAYIENLNTYNENELIYKRGIKNLEEIIKNSLLRNTDDYETISYNGDLIPSLIWKSVKGIDSKIFKKSFKDHKGDISVDIILDQSASQYERQSNVAIEGFIIAEALTNLNIKTRVIGFNNFFNYMVIREYRDYNDSKIKNKEIFKYTASGSNRDGLIVKLMTEFIEKNQQQRRLMIILSDGKPNDEINLGIIGGRSLDAKDYVDEDAILDSFNQVLISRLKGIDVLGVFMGEEEDLPAEKKIFGQNFAYITDIKRFHHVVGIFFKSVAKEFYD